MKNKRKKAKWLAIIAGTAILLGAGIYYRKPKKNSELTNIDKEQPLPTTPKRKALNVNATIIKHGLLEEEFMVTGILLPDEEVDLSFESSGQITDIYFEEGTFVTKGTLLAKVNDQKLQAELKRLLVQLQLAEDRVERQRTLLQHDAVSQEAFDQVSTELATLNAEIDVIKAQIELTELRAPFDGIIGLRQISVGAYASPTTVVSKLTKINPLKVEFSIPERYAHEVGYGTELTFTVDGFINSFPAKVYAKASSIDINTHTMAVRALYDNSNGRLTPGRYTSITLKKQSILDAIAIPSEAIVPEMGKDKVFLYKSGKAVPVELRLGIRTEDKVQVLTGLNVGDTVITSGTLQLRTGLQVTIDKIN